MRNMVGKHYIIGSKECIPSTSLIGLCDVEGKGEVKCVSVFLGMVIQR